MVKHRTFIPTCGLAGVLMLAGAGHAEVIRVEPRATYLRTGSDPLSLSAVPISLEALGLLPGERVSFQTVGGFAYTGNTSLTDNSITLLFSSTPVLLGPEALHRVPGAIDAGADTFTLPVFFGRAPTDIPEDFAGLSTPIVIPEAARYIFVSVLDSFFSDNSDPSGTFGLIINRVPTPGAMALMGTAALCSLRRRRRS
ncbi:MAG: hypothetical protein ACT4PL_09035 [Phycisphaerales bacterium]